MPEPTDSPIPQPSGNVSGVYQRLRRAREETGLTQAQVAEFVGVPRNGLAELESGKAPPEQGLLVRLASLLGVDANWLTGRGSRVVRPQLSIETGTIDRAMRAHVGWRSALLADLDSGRTPDPRTVQDAAGCDFGRWLDENRSVLERHPLFAELVATHAETHRTAAAAAELAVARRGDRARESLRSGEAFWASVHLVSLLNRMRPNHADSGNLDGERTFPVWSQRYALGHPVIDDQHQELFRRTADIHMAVIRGEGGPAIGRMIGFLVEYAQSHFLAEEAILRAAGCPDLDRHIQRHRALSETVGQLDRRLDAGEDVALLEVCWFLADWLSDHIISEDLPNAKRVAELVSRSGGARP